MTKRLMAFGLVAAGFALSVSTAFACDKAVHAAEAKDAKDAKAVASAGDTKGCDMPCCAHDKAAPAKAEVAAKAETPCARHEGAGCAKKKSTAAPAAIADAAAAQPAAGAGSQR
jgi:hypothetical protein